MNHNYRLRSLIAGAMILCFAVTATGFDFSTLEKQVTEHTLKNGLKIIVLENHDAPVASFVTVANVGSADDPKGYGGLAHMFEHMAFKGTTTLGTTDWENEKKAIAVEDSLFMALRAERNKGRLTDSAKVDELQTAYEEAREASYKLVEPNAFGQTIDREGGVGLNAGTASDFTIYFYSLPSNKVELWMSLESERFLDPVLREMYKERDVVAEERRMRIESNPIGRLIEELLAMSFKTHPYGTPGVGAMSDIQYYSRKEARAFFEKYYSPSNLTVAIVGDVNTKKVIKMAEKYFGRIPYRPAPERIATVEPEQLGERRMVIEDKSQPIFAIAWHIPEGTHPDRPAIDAMLDYLGQGRTSLLYKQLVKQQKAAVQIGAFSGFPGDKYPTLSLIFAIPSQGHTNQECEETILANVKLMQEELLPVEEVDKIKARAKASFIGGLGTNGGMGQQLAIFQTMWGDWREMFTQLGRLNKVTPEDIQRVAKKYFTHNNRNVAVIENLES